VSFILVPQLNSIHLTPQLAVKNIFIRGSVVRYVRMPARTVDTTLLEDATRREARNTK
jgi:U6 snRNA-associated Sm-like protein LSm2